MTHGWPWHRPGRSLTALSALLFAVVAFAPTVGADVDAHFSRIAGATVWSAPQVDVAKLVQEDAFRLAEPGGVLRIGLPQRTSLTPADSGTWVEGPGAELTWRLPIRSQGALWLILGFDLFAPAEGSRLWVSAPDGSSRRGPYTRADAIDGRLWVPPIEGDTAIVELEWPRALADTPPAVRIGTVSHGYRPWGFGEGSNAAAGAAAECEIDVNCELGDAWQEEKRGVVRVVIEGGLAACTGSLVNNTAFDCAGYVYTADHCFTNPMLPNPDLASLMFVFNHEQPSCEPGLAPAFEILTGAEDVARWPPADARLLRLLQPIPAGFDVYFNGWNRSTGAPPAQSTVIHHPVGGVKKISFNDDPLFNSPAYTSGTHWRVDNWEQGVTEGGSSGAPLFDTAGRIVGELHRGTSTCSGTGDQFDDFGRFSSAWLGGGTSITSLRPWLDPANSGVTALLGMDTSFCGAAQPRLVHMSHETDDEQGNESGAVDPGDVARISLRLRNEGPLAATGIVAADLSTEDPQVKVLVDHARYSTIPAGQSAVAQAPGYTVDIDPARDCDRSILFDVEAAADQGSWPSSFRLYLGEEVGTMFALDEDMEPPGPSGWNTQGLQGSAQWVLQSTIANSPVTAWHLPNSAPLQDTALRSPLLTDLPARATLRFVHAMSSGSGDGGVLEYSTNGSVWIDARPLMLSGVYNSRLAPFPTSNSPLAGRFLWTAGDLGVWREVVVDLSQFEGDDLWLRWRFAADGSGQGIGWFLDDVVIEAPQVECAPAHDRRLPGAVCRGHRPGSTFGDCPARRTSPTRPAPAR